MASEFVYSAKTYKAQNLNQTNHLFNYQHSENRTKRISYEEKSTIH